VSEATRMLCAAEDARSAAVRLEHAIAEAKNVAGRIEDSIRELRTLTENGYGNNVELLIQKLQELPKTP